MTAERSPASFRDPSGFVFQRDGVVYRQIHASYERDYKLLLSSGLYDELVSDRFLVPHEEVPIDLAATADAIRVLRPAPVHMISYPYEWCFGQLQDAALLTLEVQKRAMARGLTLKDASAFNIQFHEGRPILIDTLSFEKYEEGTPWVAYRQLCQHFLAPLLLMSHVDIRLGKLSALHLDGVPLDLASQLLPRRTWLRLSSVLHVHLHARSIARYGRRMPGGRQRSVSRRSLEALLDNLNSAIARLRYDPARTQWARYEDEHTYGPEGLEEKKRLVAGYLSQVRPEVVWDLGANTGTFSRLAADAGARVLAMDSDGGAVERMYRRLKDEGDGRIQPLLVDLTNPSPGLGWSHKERSSLSERGPADAVLALALIHHLAISGNLPLPLIAEWMASLAPILIVEFVPKEDPQTQRLLSGRNDVFSEYDRSHFEAAFSREFDLLRSDQIHGTSRQLYLMAGKHREWRPATSSAPLN